MRLLVSGRGHRDALIEKAGCVTAGAWKLLSALKIKHPIRVHKARMGAPYLLLLLLSRASRKHAVSHADWLSSIAGVVDSAAAGGTEVPTAA